MNEGSNSKLKGILLTIGPGILFAGAAIGGSHLVQFTRAGADYGFTLISIVLLVLIFKYPFFEFVHRYTAAMDESTELARTDIPDRLLRCLYCKSDNRLVGWQVQSRRSEKGTNS
jgi:Mn2+/Fe2+ NRAMP family transporter